MLDAYAQHGDVTQIPGDIASQHMEDLPWLHPGPTRDNPQQAIFEACRRYLVDKEQTSGEIGSTWMLTNDIDEFLWFDRQFDNATNALTKMLTKSYWQRMAK